MCHLALLYGDFLLITGGDYPSATYGKRFLEKLGPLVLDNYFYDCGKFMIEGHVFQLNFLIVHKEWFPLQRMVSLESIFLPIPRITGK